MWTSQVDSATLYAQQSGAIASMSWRNCWLKQRSSIRGASRTLTPDAAHVSAVSTITSQQERHTHLPDSHLMRMQAGSHLCSTPGDSPAREQQQRRQRDTPRPRQHQHPAACAYIAPEPHGQSTTLLSVIPCTPLHSPLHIPYSSTSILIASAKHSRSRCVQRELQQYPASWHGSPAARHQDVVNTQVAVCTDRASPF